MQRASSTYPRQRGGVQWRGQLEKNIKIDEAKLFDQLYCLMKFVETQDEKVDELLCHEKWTLFLKVAKQGFLYRIAYYCSLLLLYDGSQC